MKEIEVPRHAARKTGTLGETTLTQLAWLRRTRQIAEQMLAPKYTRAHGVAAVEKLRALLKSAEELRQVPRILMEAGIRFVLVESLPSAKIDGVCLWLNEAAPVIGMSMRHDRIDNFWFVLRHEMEHVLCEHGQAEVDGVLDTELEGARAGVGEDISEEERAANRAAAEFCVPQKALDQFIARKSPFFAERDIVGFANTLRIHPGLIAGHLQYRTGRYDRFRAHQVKVRALVAPSAMVDGWGDVAPVGM